MNHSSDPHRDEARQAAVFSVDAARVLVGVADHLTTIKPTDVLDRTSLRVAIGTEAYRLTDRSLSGGAHALARETEDAAPDLDDLAEGITRGDYAAHLLHLLNAERHEWGNDANAPVIPPAEEASSPTAPSPIPTQTEQQTPRREAAQDEPGAFSREITQILTAVAAHFAEVRPAEELEDGAPRVAISVELYDRCEGNVTGRAVSLARAALAATPVPPDGITRGDYAALLFSTHGQKQNNGAGEQTVPRVPGPRPATGTTGGND